MAVSREPEPEPEPQPALDQHRQQETEQVSEQGSDEQRASAPSVSARADDDDDNAAATTAAAQPRRRTKKTRQRKQKQQQKQQQKQRGQTVTTRRISSAAAPGSASARTPGEAAAKVRRRRRAKAATIDRLAHPKLSSSAPSEAPLEPKPAPRDVYVGSMRTTAADAIARRPIDELRAWVSDKLPNPPETETSACSLDLLAPVPRWGRAQAARQQRRLTERLADPDDVPNYDCKPFERSLRIDRPSGKPEPAVTPWHVPTVDSLLVSAVVSSRKGNAAGSAVLAHKVAWETDAAEKVEMAALIARRRQKQCRNSRAFEQACAVREARYRKS